MFGNLFDSDNRKEKEDNIERYDDKRRKDNNRGQQRQRTAATATMTAEAAARDLIVRT